MFIDKRIHVFTLRMFLYNQYQKLARIKALYIYALVFSRNCVFSMSYIIALYCTSLFYAFTSH